MSNECPKKETTPNKDWYINKLKQSHAQSIKTESQTRNNDTSDDNQSKSNPQGPVTSWCGAHFHLEDRRIETHGQMTNLEEIKKVLGQDPDELILDTGSSITLLTNKDLGCNIRKADNPILVATNTGVGSTEKQMTMPGMENEVWLNEKGLVNVLGFSNIADQAERIVYDSDVEDAFTVTLKNGKVVRFQRNNKGLYTFKVPATYKEAIKANRSQEAIAESYLMPTVKENQQKFTKRQIEKAREARKLYHIMGAPSPRNFKAILRQNLIHNCPVIPEDIDICLLYTTVL